MLWTWVGAVVLGLVVLGFCAYEIAWKIKRLGRDVDGLQELQTRLATLQAGVTDAGDTAATIQANRAHNRNRQGDALFPHPRDPRPAEAGRPA